VEPAVIVAEFNREFMRSRCPWTTHYKGVSLIKSPLDLWIYAELIWKIKPRTIIETGTHLGGSALWFADQLDLFGIDGHVYTIDVLSVRGPQHPRLTYLTGTSVVVPLPELDGPVLVVLDSDHSAEHVYNEMVRFAPLVTVGSYLIVEDTNVPRDAPDLPGGAADGVARFLAEHGGFEIDGRCERYLQSCNPGGYLRRVS